MQTWLTGKGCFKGSMIERELRYYRRCYSTEKQSCDLPQRFLYGLSFRNASKEQMNALKQLLNIHASKIFSFCSSNDWRTVNKTSVPLECQNWNCNKGNSLPCSCLLMTFPEEEMLCVHKYERTTMDGKLLTHSVAPQGITNVPQCLQNQ